MCDNIIVLYVFMILKFIFLVILPIIIIIKRKKKIFNILLLIEILALLIIVICNVFTINKCIYNSNIKGIERAKNKNQITLYNELHPIKPSNYNSYYVNANTNYTTAKNEKFYYYNQNLLSLTDAYYECGGNNIYIDSFGSGLSAFSMAVSTLYDKNINPVTMFYYYRAKNENLCNVKFDIQSMYNYLIERYGGITLSEISSNEIYSSVKNGGLVIAELSANENSKITCDSNYIVIYNISLDGNYKIAIPNQADYDYICSYSSPAYGNIIESDNMEKTWSIDEINNEAVKYYLVKKG